MAPAGNMQKKGPELTAEIMRAPERRWQLLRQTQIVAQFNKVFEARIPHLVYQRDTQITARIRGTLSGLPAGIVREQYRLGYFRIAHQSLRCPLLVPLFSQNWALSPAWSWNQWLCFPTYDVKYINTYGSFLTGHFPWCFHCCFPSDWTTDVTCPSFGRLTCEMEAVGPPPPAFLEGPVETDIPDTQHTGCTNTGYLYF